MLDTAQMGVFLPSVDQAGVVKLWDPSSLHTIAEVHSQTDGTGLAFAPNGLLIAVAGSSGDVQIIDVANGEIAHTLSAN